jgi:hypothetical protein
VWVNPVRLLEGDVPLSSAGMLKSMCLKWAFVLL